MECADKFKEAFKQYKRATEIVSKNGYTIVVKFTDGKTGMLDLRDVLPPSTLSEVISHHPIVEFGVILWPNVGETLISFDGEPDLFPYEIHPIKAWMHTKF